ncbi:hypothetical protein [Octadecabacter sp. R77987]|uniref:hypothetical protein n=1 Tax=Octadecabacter sp. R77987 TaxID=3093874 RepID=UPI00366FEF5A
MKKLILGAVLLLAACEEMPAGAGFGAAMGGGSTGGGGGFREYLVLGSSMSFEECRSRGGIIIRDNGSPMVACDPRVTRQPVPANEFDHPGSPVPQAAETETTEG